MMKRQLVLIFTLIFFSPLMFGQIEQLHPELCGLPDNTVPPLPSISISVDKLNGSAKLFSGEGTGTTAIELPGVVEGIAEVCPLGINRYLIFGDTHAGTNMIIVDLDKRTIVDTFDSMDPAMSPDRRWVVYRKFYPTHHDLPISEQYLVYDLKKTAAQNRPAGIPVSDRTDVGMSVYPVGRTNQLDSSVDLPEDRTHSVGSNGFYWSADSRAVLFGDILQNQFAIITAIFNSDGPTNVYQYPVATSNLCKGKLGENFYLVISHGTITENAQGDYSAKADFMQSPDVCEPRSVEIPLSKFRGAKPEVPFQHNYKRFSAVVDQ